MRFNLIKSSLSDGKIVLEHVEQEGAFRAAVRSAIEGLNLAIEGNRFTEDGRFTRTIVGDQSVIVDGGGLDLEAGIIEPTKVRVPAMQCFNKGGLAKISLCKVGNDWFLYAYPKQDKQQQQDKSFALPKGDETI